MYYSIDRFEEKLAILIDDNGNTKDVPRRDLPTHARQGDILILKNGCWVVDECETTRRRDYVLDLQQRLIDE